MGEQAKFWREPRFGNLELLHARFITHAFSRHIHDTFAIGVIQQGAEAFSYRGATHVAPSGCIVLINPGEPHTGYAADLAQGWTYRMLYPAVSLLQTAAENSGLVGRMPYFSEAVIWDEPLMRMIVRLHLTLERSHSQLEKDSRLLWALTQLVARHGSDRPALHPTGHEAQPVQRVRDYLEAHLAENPSLEELAAIANLSPFYLLRTFRKQVGLPPHGYLNQVRLIRAKDLLCAGMPISQVAQATGFADQSHLTRQFKRMVGVTPGQFKGKQQH